MKDDMDEITCLLRGDFLSENPDQAISPWGKHNVLVNRWKGMTQEQLMAIREFQKEQALEKQVFRLTCIVMHCFLGCNNTTDNVCGIKIPLFALNMLI